MLGGSRCRNWFSATLPIKLSFKSDGRIALLLSDPLAVVGTFLLGASAGALVTYLKQRRLIAKTRRPLEEVAENPKPTNEDRFSFGMVSLIVGHDPEMVAIFSDLFRDIGIATQACYDPSSAIRQLSSEKFEAIVLDFDQIAECADILKRMPRPNQRILVFAVATESASKQAATDLGASFVIERPLVPSQMRDLVRRAYGRMLRDGQSYFRLGIELPISIRRVSGTLVRCTTLNLSQTGAAVTTPSSFLVGEHVNLAFAIPNTDIFVSAEGKVIWDDKHGKAGISFACTSSSIQARFVEWLNDHFFMPRDGAAPFDSSKQVVYGRDL